MGFRASAYSEALAASVEVPRLCSRENPRRTLRNYRFGACGELTFGNNQPSALFKSASAVPSIGSL
jgi:hypothetical protein